MEQSFLCLHCGREVTFSSIGTHQRNHCPYCLWSKHVDGKTPGDRQSTCHGAMEPIGLTFKHEGKDKYGKTKQGELMIIHVCSTCKKININRIAGDDAQTPIMSLLQTDISEEIHHALEQSSITLLVVEDAPQVRTQLFGSV